MSELPSQQAQGTALPSVGERTRAGIHIPLLITTLLLVGFGSVVILSASQSIPQASLPRHIFGIVIGLIAAFFVWRYDYKKLSNYVVALFLFNAFLLIAPLLPVIGVESKGITAWIKIPVIGLTFQTSELAKLVTILFMSAIVAQYNGKIPSVKEYIKACTFLGITFLLILLQPDLGQGLVFLICGAAIIICGGADKKWIFATIGILVALVTLVIVLDPVIDSIAGRDVGLKEYQIARLNVFVDSDIEEGYNLEQSLIAVGSGGVLGKGFGNATQSSGGFLPEAHTDFVFSFLAEEFGFAGALILLVLFLSLILNALYIGRKSESVFGALICIGIATMWIFQVFQSIGMSIGLMPITGIPLPFISYGSSSMISQLIAVGLLMAVWRSRILPTISKEPAA